MDLQKGSITFEGNYTRKIQSIENIVLPLYKNIVHDSVNDESIVSGWENDIIYLSDGNDAVDCGGGDDVVHLSGKGKKIIAGGFGHDKFVIHDTYFSENKLDTIISDFEIKTSLDRIDLTSILSIKQFSDLKFEQIQQGDQVYSLIVITPTKYIALQDIDISTITKENFIFSEVLLSDIVA